MIKTMIRIGNVNFWARSKNIQRLVKGSDYDRDLYQWRTMFWDRGLFYGV